MAKVWEPKNPVLLRSWVDTILLEASDDLNEWETKFINDMESLLDIGRRLSQAQEEKLETIYADKTK